LKDQNSTDIWVEGSPRNPLRKVPITSNGLFGPIDETFRHVFTWNKMFQFEIISSNYCY